MLKIIIFDIQNKIERREIKLLVELLIISTRKFSLKKNLFKNKEGYVLSMSNFLKKWLKFFIYQILVGNYSQKITLLLFVKHYLGNEYYFEIKKSSMIKMNYKF